MGADSFLDLPHWKSYRRLLDLVDIIVVSRPGFQPDDIPTVLPRDLLSTRANRRHPDRVLLRHTTLSILRGVDAPMASRDIRQAIRKGRSVAGLVPPLVEQYILKVGLYRAPEARDLER